jgi:hypothetical protein
MNCPLLKTKPVSIAFSEALVDNAAITTTEIDRLGYDWCSIYLRPGTTDIALTVCKVTHSDTAGSGHADMTGANLDAGATDIEGVAAALPSATADNTWRVIHIDCRDKKRYLDLSLTVGDGTAGGFYHAFAILSNGDNHPLTNAGCANTSGKCYIVP